MWNLNNISCHLKRNITHQTVKINRDLQKYLLKYYGTFFRRCLKFSELFILLYIYSVSATGMIILFIDLLYSNSYASKLFLITGNYFFSKFVFILFIFIFVVIALWNIAYKPNEVISAFLENAANNITKIIKDSNLKNKKEIVDMIEYSLDFFPQPFSLYMIPPGLRIESLFYKYNNYIILLSLKRRMYYLENKLKEIMAKVVFTNKSEELTNIENELRYFSKIIKEQKFGEIPEDENFRPIKKFKTVRKIFERALMSFIVQILVIIFLILLYLALNRSGYTELASFLNLFRI